MTSERHSEYSVKLLRKGNFYVLDWTEGRTQGSGQFSSLLEKPCFLRIMSYKKACLILGMF